MNRKKPEAQRPAPETQNGAKQIADILDLSPRDRFWFQLGSTLVQAVAPPFENMRFTIVAPDDETRLLGEVYIEVQIARLGPGDAARRLAEHVEITTTGKSKIVNANAWAARKPQRLI